MRDMQKTIIAVLGASVVLGCGGDGARSDGSESGATGISSFTFSDTGSASASMSGDGDGDGDHGDGDGDPGSADGGPPKFDTSVIPDSGTSCGGGGANDFEFSYLWAANSQQGTISKIDTKTVTEVGRYIVRPDSAGSPSRTSVSLSGHVAVANRNGGVTKVYADQQFCQESNGTPGIQTSNSAAYLPWGQDECIAWHKPMAYASQRPVAWGLGQFNQGTCQYEDEELWTAGTNQNGVIDIYVLDGDDGTTKEMISVPTGGNGLSNDGNGITYGIYGGAVDGNGDFWGSQLGGNARIIRVNRADMTWQTWAAPAGPWWYGMTVDADGMVWLCSATVGRFDPQTQTWATAQAGGSSGCMADASDNGLLWMASGSGIVGVNRDTLQVEKNWNTGGSYGISIDFEGYVWAVAFGNNAHKVDPDTGQFTTYGGLVGAYTYSDMTGYALSNVGIPNG
ncbi:Vgb family protein [Enhygromyxa salina]|uniref:Methionine ABC transporter ATP-binding protein n=1 Tax=Enhygromyxa salina TaxID=215803 RepID=A0A2S9YU43_9BACT|nr:hypothetical protein [Enhygromyxa salina]PRQ08635.1 hypothetical protein ENSA7_16410 [Enhygromyxa salina]